MTERLPGAKERQERLDKIAFERSRKEKCEQWRAEQVHEAALKQEAEKQKAKEEKQKLQLARKVTRKARWISVTSGSLLWGLLFSGMAAGFFVYGDAVKNKKMEKIDRDTIEASAWLASAMSALGLILFMILSATHAKKIKPRNVRAMMEEMKQSYVPYDTNKNLQDLGKLGLEILRKYSQIDEEYFEKLLKGDYLLDFDYDQSVAVIKGHLEKHPEDMDKVLAIYEAIDLPADLLDEAEGSEEIKVAKEKLIATQNKQLEQVTEKSL